MVTAPCAAAADTYPATAAKGLVANIRRARAGTALNNQVDPTQGY